MKWRELKNFLNTKFHDDDYISLTVNFISGNVVIVKDSEYSGIDHTLVLQDNTSNECSVPSWEDNLFKDDDILDDSTPFIFTTKKTNSVEYTESEISKYFTKSITFR